jgi:hypothetical protein
MKVRVISSKTGLSGDPMQAVNVSLSRIAVLGVLMCFTPLAQSQQGSAYPETGTVKLFVSGMGTFKNSEYMITTNHAIYWAQCTHLKDKSREPDCSFNRKTIANGDTINFRVESDSLILPPGEKGKEQQLPVRRTELNPYPETPAPGKNGIENAVIVAVNSYKNVLYLSSFVHEGCSSRPAQTTESNLPKAVSPRSSAADKSPSGSPQVIGMAMAMTPQQSDDIFCMMSKNRPLDSLKLITSDRVYEITCMNEGPCQVNGQPLRLGGRYFVRVVHPTMWIATDPGQFSDKSDLRISSGLLYPGSQKK